MQKTFTKNKNGKIEFSEYELKSLLDEVYKAGAKEGKDYWWKSPLLYNPNTITWYSNEVPKYINDINLNTNVTPTNNILNPSGATSTTCRCNKNETSTSEYVLNGSQD